MVNWLLPVRALQFIFAIIVIGISGYCTQFLTHRALLWAISLEVLLVTNVVTDVGQVDDPGFSSSRTNYNLFTGLWTIVVLVYLIGILFIFKDSAISHPLGSIVLDGLTWLFWTAAFACAAAVISGNDRVSLIGALTAFGVLEWYDPTLAVMS